MVSADGHCRLTHLPFDLWTNVYHDDFWTMRRGSCKSRTASRQWVVEGHRVERRRLGWGWSGPVNCYTRAGLAEEPEPGIFCAATARYRCEDMDRDGVDADLSWSVRPDPSDDEPGTPCRPACGR